MKAYISDTAKFDIVNDAADRIVVSARVARGGNVQLYSGRELGLADRQTVRVYRPADEVFDRDSMATFPHKFVTLTHPKGKADFATDAVGWIGDEVARDGEFIRVPMTIAHRKALDAVRGGVRELSVGYEMELRLEDGKSPAGEAYDAIMTGIVVDHVAIVDRARGGTDLRIGDNNGAKPMKTFSLDGLSVTAEDRDAEIIQRHIAGLEKQLADARAALTVADKTEAEKDAEIDKLKKQVKTGDQLDALVRDRADLLARVKTLAPKVATDGKSDGDIRRAVLVDRGIAVDGKSDDYVAARFDALTEAADSADPISRALAGRAPVVDGADARAARDAAIRARDADLNSWRDKQAH